MTRRLRPLTLCILPFVLGTLALPARAQDIVESAGITSIRVSNTGAGDVEVAFDIPVCAAKPGAPQVAVVERGRSTNFEATVSVLMAAMLGKLRVRTQTGGPTCTIQFIWIPRG